MANKRRSHPGRGGYPSELKARAVGLCFFGMGFAEVGARVGVSPPSVMNWWRDPEVRAAAAAARSAEAA